jgi:orotate phosphoribosyltransferase
MYDMQNIKSSFIKLALNYQVLTFGQFTLKSGRLSPYFFNMGHFHCGKALQQLGQFYAATLQTLEFEHLFGPAYKGIPLATATAIALSSMGRNVSVSFNRKEVKNHGEGGTLIGAPLSGKTVMIDDVITAGTAFREARPLIEQSGATLCGIVIALDRCERGLGAQSALDDIRAQGIPVYSIITLFDLMDYLHAEGKQKELKAIEAYQQQYGILS